MNITQALARPSLRLAHRSDADVKCVSAWNLVYETGSVKESDEESSQGIQTQMHSTELAGMETAMRTGG